MANAWLVADDGGGLELPAASEVEPPPAAAAERPEAAPRSGRGQRDAHLAAQGGQAVTQRLGEERGSQSIGIVSLLE